jgi:hypothetical protein
MYELMAQLGMTRESRVTVIYMLARMVHEQMREFPGETFTKINV